MRIFLEAGRPIFGKFELICRFADPCRLRAILPRMSYRKSLLFLSALSASFVGCGRTDLDTEYDIQGYGGNPYAIGGSLPIAGVAATGGRFPIGGSASSGGHGATGGTKSTGGAKAIPTGGRTGATGGTRATGGTFAPATTGGKTSTGGTKATGGSRANTGGSNLAGGSFATGGSTLAGGSKATGGITSNGGTKATGGSTVIQGGTTATAGSGGIGGTRPTGGTTSIGGSTAAGGTTSTGGTTFTGGTSSTGGSSACPTYLLSNEELIDDLDDGNAAIPEISGRRGSWSDVLIDTNGASIVPDPSVPFFVTDTGDVCRKFAVYVHGLTSIDPGAGANFGFSLGGPYDASAYTGLSFWAKIDAGTNPPVRVTFPNGDTDPRGAVCSTSTSDSTMACWSHFGRRLTLTTTWTKYTIPFSSLTQDPWGYQASQFNPSTLFSITFAISDTDTFAIWVDSVAFTH